MSSSAIDSSHLPQRGTRALRGSNRDREDVVRRAQRGEVLALDLVLDELLPLVTGVCRRLAGPLWEDARQDALLVIFRKLRTLERPEALVAWTATIARREALRHARTRRDEALGSEPPAAQSLAGVELRDVLSELPAAHCEVLLLRDLIGLGERETATLLAVPPGTIKSRLHRARQAFREAWCK
jgi:RNA polymerase sigma factor (sigma-70 family)